MQYWVAAQLHAQSERMIVRVTPWDSSTRWCRRRRWRCAWWPGCATWAPCSRCSPPGQSGQWLASAAAWPHRSPSPWSPRLLRSGPTAMCLPLSHWRASPLAPQSRMRKLRPAVDDMSLIKSLIKLHSKLGRKKRFGQAVQSQCFFCSSIKECQWKVTLN